MNIEKNQLPIIAAILTVAEWGNHNERAKWDDGSKNQAYIGQVIVTYEEILKQLEARVPSPAAAAV